MNELSLESSPYLLQHANNPIHWKAWSESALKIAKTQNKLIVLSIGYSACHWCHVMEHESFESEDVAEIMNKSFVSIKIDREERPDVDAIYMKAVQIMTRQGGWPLNVVCLPDGRPVWGGTYFNKENWIASLEQLQNLYLESPEKMIDYAEKLHQGILSLGLIQKNTNPLNFDSSHIKPLIEKWSKSFDWDFGGYTRAPKFMMPNNYLFLQRYGHQTNSKDVLDFVDLTLTRMAYGGLFDTVEGGFSRYSVDLRWHIPHFEKMLYDNGQLITLYAEAYKRTKNPIYKEVIEKTLHFIEHNLWNSEHAFYSALDADSLNELGELEEGAYYVWTKEELEKILDNDFEIAKEVYNVNRFGHWEKDQYVLIQTQSLEELASEFKISIEVLKKKKKDWEALLLKNKTHRPKPRLDDKSLTSWNAIMLKGFTTAYQALEEPKYLDVAMKNADFIIQKQWSSEGFLYHSYKDGKSSIEGFLEDYAFVIEALITLYQTTLKEGYLTNAKQLTDYCFEHFYDEQKGLFSFNSKNQNTLIAEHFELEDNVIPASNSVMANNLYLLSVFFNNPYYEKTAQKMLHQIQSNIDYPSAFSNWMNLWLNFALPMKELAVCGSEATTNIQKINSHYLPSLVVSGTEKKSDIPFLQNRFETGKQLFYICENKTCSLPVESVETTLNNLIY